MAKSSKYNTHTHTQKLSNLNNYYALILGYLLGILSFSTTPFPSPSMTFFSPVVALLHFVDFLLL